MLIIRDQQVAVLSEARRRDFENRMVIHLRRFFPEPCSALGDSGVLEAIRYGIERASIYGVRIERDVCVYIDLMFLLGKYFDEDLALPWAAEILNDDAMPDPSGRMRMLYDESLRRVSDGSVPLATKGAPSRVSSR